MLPAISSSSAADAANVPPWCLQPDGLRLLKLLFWWILIIQLTYGHMWPPQCMHDQFLLIILNHVRNTFKLQAKDSPMCPFLHRQKQFYCLYKIMDGSVNSLTENRNCKGWLPQTLPFRGIWTELSLPKHSTPLRKTCCHVSSLLAAPIEAQEARKGQILRAAPLYPLPFRSIF